MTRLPMLVAGFAATIVGFGWPFLAAGHPGALAGDAMAPVVVAAVLALVLTWLLAEVTRGGLDAKAVALLGLLTALGVALRAVGPAVAGLEPTFPLIILAARVFGGTFGFCYGSVLMTTSALLTGGVGPWLPFQLLATSWLGLAAGSLPAWGHGRRYEGALLGVLAAPAALVYGAALNLSFWPVTSTLAPALAYQPADSLSTNLTHYLAFYLATSLGWDVARAAWTLLALSFAGPPLLAALRRAGRRSRILDQSTSVSTKGGLTTSNGSRRPRRSSSTSVPAGENGRSSSASPMPTPAVGPKVPDVTTPTRRSPE
jgi:energy-coupling factor transport system substrate-specific component